MTPNRCSIIAVNSLSEMCRDYKDQCGYRMLLLWKKVFTDTFLTQNLMSASDCPFRTHATFVIRQHTVDPQWTMNSIKLEQKADKDASKFPDGPAVERMDLQQVLPTPNISTGKVFYSQQLWIYNFGLHLCNDDSAVMYVWPEFKASRHTDEIGFCHEGQPQVNCLVGLLQRS